MQEIAGSAARNSERFEIAGSDLFAKVHDLTAVVSVVYQLPLKCAYDRVRFVADIYGLCERGGG